MAPKEWSRVLDSVAALAMTAASGVLVWSIAMPRTAAVSRPDLPLPSDPISIEGSAFKGSQEAPVAIIEFSDFQCPYCGTFAQRILPTLEKDFIDSGQVRFVLKHLPLESIHPFARAAAIAAHCAGEAGRFWEVHDLLWRQAGQFDAESVLALAAGTRGTDKTAFDVCVGSTGPAAVAADIALAKSLGLRSTPTFFVGRVGPDGVEVTGRVSGAAPLEHFRDAILVALGNSAAGNGS